MLFRKKPVVVEAVQWTGNNREEILSFSTMAFFDGDDLKIHTLEGDHLALIGDYIIKGVHGEFYPCKEDIFRKTYEEVL